MEKANRAMYESVQETLKDCEPDEGQSVIEMLDNIRNENNEKTDLLESIAESTKSQSDTAKSIADSAIKQADAASELSNETKRIAEIAEEKMAMEKSSNEKKRINLSTVFSGINTSLVAIANSDKILPILKYVLIFLICVIQKILSFLNSLK